MTQLRALTSLQYRDYRLLWFGHIFTSMAFWMDQVSRGWLIYELTDSTVQLGLVRGVQAIPILLLSPIAGSAADRYSRRTQILVAQIIDGLMFALLAILIFTGQIQPWHVYVTAFAMACVQTFQQPARAAIIGDVVPREGLTNAIGLNSIIFNVARSTGPALAGVLIVAVGTGGAFGTQAVFYILATYWTLRLRTPAAWGSGGGGGHGHSESFSRSIVEGWKFSWRNLEVRTALLVVMFASLFIVPFTTLLPVFARDILNVGASGQGFLLTAMGIGALGSAIGIATLGERLSRGVLMLGGAAAYGITVVAFAASGWFPLSVALMAVAGACNVACNALVRTVIQGYSPREMGGRVLGAFQQGMTLNTVGGLAVGALAAVWGAPWAVAIMAALGTFGAITMFLMIPGARSIR